MTIGIHIVAEHERLYFDQYEEVQKKNKAIVVWVEMIRSFVDN